MNFKCAIPSASLVVLLSACGQSETPKTAAPPKAPPKANQPALTIPAPTQAAPAPPGTAVGAATAQPAVIPDSQVKEDPGIMSRADALNLVLRDFVVQQGRPPKDLDELVSLKVIARLPEPPAGMKFVYDRQANQVSLVKK